MGVGKLYICQEPLQSTPVGLATLPDYCIRQLTVCWYIADSFKPIRAQARISRSLCCIPKAYELASIDQDSSTEIVLNRRHKVIEMKLNLKIRNKNNFRMQLRNLYWVAAFAIMFCIAHGLLGTAEPAPASQAIIQPATTVPAQGFEIAMRAESRRPERIEVPIPAVRQSVGMTTAPLVMTPTMPGMSWLVGLVAVIFIGLRRLLPF